MPKRVEERMAFSNFEDVPQERKLLLRTLFDIKNAVCNIVDESKLRQFVLESIEKWENLTKEII